MTLYSQSVRRKEILIVLVIFLASLFVHAFYLHDYIKTPAYPVLQYSDSYYYFIWAKDIAAGDYLGNRVFMKWPLYAYVLGFLFKKFHENLLTIYIFQALLGVLQSILVYFIGRKLFNRTVGLIAALLCVSYGMFTFYDGLFLYTTLSLLLNSAFFLFLLYRVVPSPVDTMAAGGFAPRAPECSLKWLAGAGVFLGVCVLAQGNILLFGIPAVLWIIMRQRWRIDRKTAGAGVFCAGLILIIGLVTFRNWMVGRDFVPVTANLGINAYIGANPEADGLFFPPEHITWNQEAMFRDAKAIARMETKQSLKPSEVSAFWTRKVLSFAYHQPVAFLKLSAQKLAYAFYIREPMHDMEFAGLRPSIRIFKVLPVDLRFILPLGFLGMALSYRRFKELFVLYLAVVVLAYSLVFFFVTTRYRITYVPFMAVFAGAGIYGIGDFFRQRKNKQCLVACCAAAALFFLLNQNLPLEVQARHDAARERIVPAYTAQGFGYLLRGDYESALKKAQEAQVIKPRHYSGFLLEGNVYYSMGLFSKAEEWLKTTIERFPYCVYAYYLLGKMYNDRARFEDGHAVLEKALFLDEDYDDIYYEFGRSLEGLGDTSAAHRAFETALRKTSHYFYSSRVQIQNALSGISQ